MSRAIARLGKKPVALALAALVTGCALGPDYHRPDVGTPEQFRWQTQEVKPGSFGDANWWDVYQDPTLVALIKTALANNLDVRIAAERVAENQASLDATRLQYLPTIDGNAEAERLREARYQTTTGQPRIGNSFVPGISASYELDLWGRVRRLNEAAKAQLLSSKFAQQAVVVALIDQVATTEFQLIDLDQQLQLTKQTVKIRQDFVALTQARHDRGVVSGLDVNAAEAQLAVAEAQVPDFERQIAQTEDQLSLLLGSNPVGQPRSGALPVLPSLPASGLPSSLLDRRPDIQEAEQNLVAANAQVGVAKANLFPTISLSGTLGALSPTLSKLLTGGASTWSAAVSALVPFLDPQRSIFQVELADASKREAILQYQKTVQGAFRDVADALIARQKNAEFVIAQDRQVSALRKYDEIALARYRQGYASYFDVIDADSQLFTAELTLASARLNALLSTVQLYQALGGGWQGSADNGPPAP